MQKDCGAEALRVFHEDWALVTAGTQADGYNTMTIGWGGLGTLWGKPAATVYVKPVRYTHSFLEKNDWFTVSFYPEECREALALLGRLSGRDGDKVAESGLTPRFLENAVTFAEARVTLLCRKIYTQPMDTAAMPEKVVETFYKVEEPHTIFIGEVVEVLR